MLYLEYVSSLLYIVLGVLVVTAQFTKCCPASTLWACSLSRQGWVKQKFSCVKLKLVAVYLARQKEESSATLVLSS